MSDGSSFYEAPINIDTDGAPLIIENSEQENISGNSNEINNNNNENIVKVKDNVNSNSDEDDVNFLTDTLVHEYKYLKHAAESYIRTSQRIFTQLQIKRQRMEEHERILRRRVELISSSANSPIIKLNIGGMRFQIQRETLLQFPMTLFHFLEGGQFHIQKDEFNYIFLDRDPLLFREILFLLRERRRRVLLADGSNNNNNNNNNSPPFLSINSNEYIRLSQLSSIERKRVMEEARYYGLNSLVTELMTHRYQWSKCVLVPISFFKYIGKRRREEIQEEIELEKEEVEPPKGCCFAACVCLHNCVYLFGGCAEQEVVLNSFYKLQLERDSTSECREDNDDFEYEYDNNNNNNIRQDYQELNEEEDEVEQVILNNNTNNSTTQLSQMRRISYELIIPFCNEDETTQPKLPEPRSGHAMISIYGRYILVFYGNDLHHHLNDIWAYHASRNIWSLVKLRGDLVEARSGHTVTVIKDRIYLIGGKNLFGSSVKLFAQVFEGRFDVNRIELTWRLVSWKNEQQESIFYQNTQSIFSNSTNANSINNLYTAIEENDDENEYEGPCEIPSIAYHTSIEYNERYIIVFGGLREPTGIQETSGENRPISNSNNGMVVVNPSINSVPIWIYKFDTLDFTWRRISTSIDSLNLSWSDIPRSGHISIRCHDDMYVMGSYTGQKQMGVYQLSLQSFIWRRIQTTVANTNNNNNNNNNCPCRRAVPSGVLLPSTADTPHPMILIYGGYNVSTRQYFNDAYILTL